MQFSNGFATVCLAIINPNATKSSGGHSEAMQRPIDRLNIRVSIHSHDVTIYEDCMALQCKQLC
jgi:hypothetical protein